ncbi:MAG: BCCT family transporter [Candidatus Hydrogenedentota bacterium]
MSQDQGTPEEKRGWFDVDIHPVVFFTSAALIIGFVAGTVVFNQFVDDLFELIQHSISLNAGWFFIWTVNIIIVVVLAILASGFGSVRIGGPDATPEFSTLSWFAMLFSAGMGIGLLFYGVAEPVSHYSGNPFTSGDSSDVEKARMAMNLTFLHWGLHPWAIYTLVALSLAFFSFNKGLPLSIRTAFYPLFGERIYGAIGNIIDIVATVATLFGVATSLGIGARQVNAGLSHVFPVIPETPGFQVFLIAAITAVATWSVVRGLDKGIRFLSEVNMVIAALFALFIFLVGPTLLILNGLLENIGYYVQHLPQFSTWKEAYEQTDWQANWTIFYWSWWIAWSPFVGMFIARVSYGRTVRQFIACVLLIPSFITFIWMTIFGNTALSIEMYGDGGIVDAVEENVAVSLFALFDQFPLTSVTALLGIVVVILFFVTSSDSGSMVIDIITSGGNPNPPVLSRLFWAILEGVVAATLLVGGGLTALQTAAISTGLPFAIVLLGMCYTLYRGLATYVAPQEFSVETEHEVKPVRVKHVPPKGLPPGSGRLW